MRDSDLLSPTLLQRASAAVVSSFNEYRHDDDVQVVTDRVNLDSNPPSPGPTPTSQAGTRASTQCWPGPSSGGSCAAGPVEVLLARRMCMCSKPSGCAAGPGPAWPRRSPITSCWPGP